jgi:cytosine/adenosine deaminase-related metal-dependent hydrolase
MITVVSAFADRSSAQTAADRLIAGGFTRSAVQLHDKATAVGNAGLLEVDEMATGGFVSNLVDLFDHLLGTAPAVGDAATYAELVRREGTLVTVHVPSPGDAAKAREVLSAAGATITSTLPQAGLEA